MKRFLLFILCISWGWMLQAQTTKIVNITAGNLYASLTETERNTITTLALIGTIDARDFKFIRDKMPVLTKLVLTQVTIASYDGNEGTSIDGNSNYPANKIPDYAFYDNDINKSNFLSIHFPPNVTVIGKHAFSKSYRFAAISLPSSVQEIETGAFSHCYNLKQISIPSFNVSIGDSTFYYCPWLNRITLGCRIPPDLSNSSKVFTYVGPSCVLYVPYGARMNYTDNEDWDFYNLQEAETGFAAKTNTVEIRGRETSQASFIVSSTTEWTARSDQDWLMINPSTGTGLSQVITVTAKANPSTTSSRKAYIELSAPGFPPQTVTVLQRALVPMKTIEIAAGELGSALTTRELDTISNLKITGTMDARDFKIMRDKMPSLTDVDLTGVTIATYTGSEGTMNNYTMNYPANEIPAYAFVKGAPGNSNLQSIMLPQSLTSIGLGAFDFCIGLTDIVIPSMVTSIKQQAFYNCSGLKSVTLPSSIISMESNCFAYCIKLSSITVGSSIPPDFRDSNGAFMSVDKNLCELKVPYGSAQNYRNAYEWKDFNPITEATNGFHVSSNNIKVDGTAGSTAKVEINANTEWTVHSDQDWLVVNPTSGNGVSQVITFTAEANPSFIHPRTAYITIAAPGATAQSIAVTQSAHPQSPKTLEATPGGLATAFTAEELASIYDLTLTGSIDARDFKTMRDKMPLLAKLDLSGSTIVSYNGTEGTSLYGTTDYPANTIPEYAFIPQISESQGKTTLTSIVLPESLTAIGTCSFTLCPSLTNVIIPASVTDIGTGAFWGCRSMTEITIPSAVTTIGLRALGYFNGAIHVASDNPNYMSSNNVLFNKPQTELIQYSGINSGNYEIPSTVTTIGGYAFSNCDLLTSVTIPSSVTFIGGSAFEWCQRLKSIYAHPITPVDLNASPNVFYQVNECILYIPVGSKTAYQTAHQWENFWYIMEINPDLIAYAGPDQHINESELVTLNGSVYINTSGNPVTYTWNAPEGITLSSLTVANPTFTAPEVTYDTFFPISLTISDGVNTSATDEVGVTIRNVNKPPVAHAGVDQTVNENSWVTLDGSASFDPDNDYINFDWIAPYPISLNSAYTAKPTFKIPNVSYDTPYTIYLRVNDGYSTHTDTVVITVRNINQVPVAHAGDVQMVNEGATVTLDATRSTDADGDALTYKWTAPEGITLSSLTSATPSFTVPSVESDTWFTFKLVVNDGKVNSVTSQVSVLVRNVPSMLNLLAKMNNLASGVHVKFQLFMYDGNSFIHKRDTFAVTGDSLHIWIEPGYWIGLVAPARDPSAFVPTWSGNVQNWNDAEIIHVPVNSVAYMEIRGIAPQAANTGAGLIAGFVYEKPNDGTKSISISRQENLAMNNPIQNALVQLYKKGSAIPVASVFTDEQGAYQFEKLELTDYEIVVEIPGSLQSERFPVALTDKTPSTKVWFGVDLSLQTITDNRSWKASMLKVYPNPTKGVVHIEGMPESGVNTVSIYLMDGRIVVATQPLTEGKVDLSQQVPGMYLLIVNNERFKIIKK